MVQVLLTLVSLLTLLLLLSVLIKSRLITLALWVICAGILGNQIAVMSNNWKMPVYKGTITIEERDFRDSKTHQLATKQTRFAVLTDFIHLKPLQSIVSVGDILMSFAVLLPACWCLRRWYVNDLPFFEKNIPISYKVVFMAMLAPYIVIALRLL